MPVVHLASHNTLVPSSRYRRPRSEGTGPAIDLNFEAMEYSEKSYSRETRRKNDDVEWEFFSCGF